MAVSRRRAVFLDKDGTLLRDLPYNVDPEDGTHAGGAGGPAGVA
jgi:histidinol phosphatase-like enzyme